MNDLKNKMSNDEIFTKCMDAKTHVFKNAALNKLKQLELQMTQLKENANRIRSLIKLRDNQDKEHQWLE